MSSLFMKWFIALLAVSILPACTTKPWMVGSVNDRCGGSGMGKYKEPAPIEAEVYSAPSSKGGKWSGSVMP
jgi:hypothetical protein